MKGEVRNPTTVWLLAVVTCGLYGLYWYFTMGNELKNYLGKEDLNPTMDIVITLVCGIYALYLPIKYGKIIQEAQMRAGIPNPEDQGVKFLLFMFLCSYGYAKMQEELNKIWKPVEARPPRSDPGPLASHDSTPDPAPPVSGVCVSGERIGKALIPIVILGLLVVSDMLLCPIRLLLGFPCPGCGVTRATFSVLHGDFAEALRHHPLVWLITPLVLWTLGRITLVSAGLVSPTSYDPMDRLPKWFWLAAMGLLIGTWVVRLAGGLGGPSDPVDLANGLIGRALGWAF